MMISNVSNTLKKIAAVIALMTVAVATTAQTTSASSNVEKNNEQKVNTMNNISYRGKIYLVRLDNGVVFRNTYSADGTKMRYEVLEGMPVSTEEVTLMATEVSQDLHFVSWVEKSGTTVSHVLDLNTNTLKAFWTWQDANGRHGELHVGTIELAPATVK
ncbi:MoaF-related domain-containing protein [Undibacterium sp. SXout11W]|uniref:MoaF-related domain-containing protein n=1 Tax=Undibacterium sp. SXout11W TaxID=3413050 RepID=UPI003BF363AB